MNKPTGKGPNKWLPELRFPEFKGAWNISSLGKIALISSGGTPSRSMPSYWEGDIPWVSTTLINFNKINTVNESITELGLSNSSAKVLAKGTILMAMYGQGKTRGKVAILDITASINQACAAISLRKGMNIEFVFQNLASRYDEIRDISNQGGQENLSAGLIKDIPFFYPDTESGEQQKIADCLSSLDELVSAHNQKLDALKAHKKGLMQQLFPAEGETVPELRFPEFINMEPWEAKYLLDTCNLQAGKFVKAAEIKEQLGNSLYPCYGGNGLRGFTKTFTHEGEYSLIGRQGALCGNITFVCKKFHATEHAVVVTPKDNVNKYWLYYELVRLDLNRFATGQAQPGLSVDNLRKVKTTIPKVEAEQQKIADCLSSLDELITAQNQKIESLKIHKKGLMQQLFPNINKVNT